MKQAELEYWQTWDRTEGAALQAQRKSLADKEADQKKAQDQLAAVEREIDTLLRTRENLENQPVRSDETRQRIDALAQEFEHGESRLAEAQKNYDDITTQARAMQASLDAVQASRYDRQRAEDVRLRAKSRYEAARHAASAQCDPAKK